MKIFNRYFGAFTDRQLVRIFLRTGNETAFRELYRRHTPKLYQLALRLLGGVEHETEEAVQETWLSAVEALPAFRWQAALRTWLTTIAVNNCRKCLRMKNRDMPNVEPERLDEFAAAGNSELLQRIDLEQAIAALPDGYRAVLVLHDVEGYKHEEIAQLLEISPGTSKSQLFHARKTVRKLLSESHSYENNPSIFPHREGV